MRVAASATGSLIAAMVGVFILSAQAGEPTGKKFITSGGLPSGEIWPGPERKLYSEGNEELIIRDFFQDRKRGFFLDVGCSTPVENSTTYYLEKHLDWSGIGIDALAEHAPAYERWRPRTKFFGYIVTDHSGTIEEFYRVREATGLSSTEEDRKWFGKKLETDTIRVPTITLNDLLEQNDVTKIDFMSLDIEEGTPKALLGFDIEKYQPKLICVEAPGAQEFLEKYFAKHNYKRIEKYRRYDFVNWYYTPKSGEGDEEAPQ